jgi:iron-sulfur cluster repair protein YtfE (RIC family)
MTTLLQPLRDEHKEMLPQIEHIRTVADSVGEVSLSALRQAVDEVREFLTFQLIPHARAEDQTLYPTIGKILGAPQATATMRRDHIEVGRLSDELASIRLQIAGKTLGDTEARALRRVLYGLYALIKVHFAKEEEIYIPILEEGLNTQEAQRLFEAMEEAARKAKTARVS